MFMASKWGFWGVVKNVHQRIQLYYGEEYGLTFHSTKGMGTYVLLKIGKNLL